MAGDNGHIFTENVTVLLIAVASAAFVVTMYHLIAIFAGATITDQNSVEQARRHRQLVAGEAAAQTPSIYESTWVSHVIPAHKYQKKNDVPDGDEDRTCAVCLGDFEEGEELRTLPECMHSFHVPCIDMWFYSHSSCPICRADATLSSMVLHRLPEFASGEMNAH